MAQSATQEETCAMGPQSTKYWCENLTLFLCFIKIYLSLNILKQILNEYFNNVTILLFFDFELSFILLKSITIN